MPDEIDEMEVTRKVEERFATFSEAYKNQAKQRIIDALRYRQDKTIDDNIVNDVFRGPLGYYPSTGQLWRDGILASINASVILSAMLAIAFGVLAVVASTRNTQSATSFLGISKIFAGAIVGAAGATTISRRYVFARGRTVISAPGARAKSRDRLPHPMLHLIGRDSDLMGTFARFPYWCLCGFEL